MVDFVKAESAPPEKGSIYKQLLQRGTDGREFVVQVAAKAVDHSDNRKRNARCDQAVFNRGRA